MKRLKIVLLFISVITLRLITLSDTLPPEWVSQSVVRVTVPIMDYPEQQDNRAVVRSGAWYITVPGYTDIMPGDLVSFEGVIERELWLGLTTRIFMWDATSEVVANSSERELGLWEATLVYLAGVREAATSRMAQLLPEPMASLASGILLGVRTTMPREFYDALLATGTVHVVAASGYNVAVVAGSIMSVLTRLPRIMSIMGAVFAITTYVLLAGAGASIVRAGIMGSLTLIGHGMGRVVEARRLLFVSGIIMLIVNPLLLVDIGFQLSFAATFGILYIVSVLQILQSKILKFANWETLSFLSDYLHPTLAATLATAPIILYHFGRVSWIGIGANLLILPVVPLIMLFAAVALVVPWVTYILYVPLWWMVAVIRWLG